ncbi:MAG TPA: Gfo/Idh/MocA family oxidoreductase, partial [Armatimonadota bacterium]|nr:Gfo/Idh/MocA family oxidoreductase [Armatimonadota bacterium]
CGGVTRTHSKTLKKSADVRRFYASRDGAKADAFNREFGGSGAFGSYQAALADPRIHAVLVATPPNSHLEWTLAALAAGKHVIVEKPPFMRAADFDAVERARDAANRRVMVAENYFYKPLAEALRKTIAAGDIGEVKVITVNAMKRQATSGWRDDTGMAGGGALFEGGIHHVNFMANLGLPVLDAHGFRPGGAGAGPERSTLAVFRYAQGAVGTLYYSWEIGSPLNGLRVSSIYGSEGAITFETNGLFLGVRGRRKRVSLLKPTDLVGYRGMFRDFADAIRRNAEPRFSLDLARRDLELVEQIYRTMDA